MTTGKVIISRTSGTNRILVNGKLFVELRPVEKAAIAQSHPEAFREGMAEPKLASWENKSGFDDFSLSERHDMETRFPGLYQKIERDAEGLGVAWAQSTEAERAEFCRQTDWTPELGEKAAEMTSGKTWERMNWSERAQLYRQDHALYERMKSGSGERFNPEAVVEGASAQAASSKTYAEMSTAERVEYCNKHGREAFLALRAGSELVANGRRCR